ncbi:hypothetical protein VNO78_30782 [Psophocarpus tetragonolobus]|uniref:Uncharacterized protein n=1 Tax=Psophocarpus tetragonolobus TaxID=3891 RepID=A0AAN9RX89_PSOTE
MANSTAATKDIPKKYRRPVNHWTIVEDSKLSQMVEQHGTRDWSLIAEHIEGRTANNQPAFIYFRSRWVHHLDPGVNRNPFTNDEEEKLIVARELYGPRWAAISKLFKGRTDKALMNRWHVLMRRKQKESKKRTIQLQDDSNDSNTSSSGDSHHQQPCLSTEQIRAPASMCSNGNWLGSMKFGSVPSFSDVFQVVDSTMEEGTGHCGVVNGVGEARNKRDSVDNSFMDLRASSSSKNVPFYDFLGVGVDDK